MPVDPVPIMPTRLPLKSTPSCGHWPVWYQSPLKSCRPGMFGTLAVDRQPTAVTRNFATNVSPCSVRTLPAIGRLVVVRGRDAAVEPDVALQVEPVGDEVQIAHDLGLAGIALGPFPFPHQLRRERVPIDVAFRIAARAGIAVPVPGAADPAARFQHLDRQAKPVAQAEQLIQTGEPGADDQRVEFGRLAGSGIPPRRSSCLRCLSVPGHRRASILAARPTDRRNIYPPVASVQSCDTRSGRGRDATDTLRLRSRLAAMATATATGTLGLWLRLWL